jgi:hypothetical protein
VQRYTSTELVSLNYVQHPVLPCVMRCVAAMNRAGSKGVSVGPDDDTETLKLLVRNYRYGVILESLDHVLARYM